MIDPWLSRKQRDELVGVPPEDRDQRYSATWEATLSVKS